MQYSKHLRHFFKRPSLKIPPPGSPLWIEPRQQLGAPDSRISGWWLGKLFLTYPAKTSVFFVYPFSPHQPGPTLFLMCFLFFALTRFGVVVLMFFFKDRVYHQFKAPENSLKIYQWTTKIEGNDPKTPPTPPENSLD